MEKKIFMIIIITLIAMLFTDLTAFLLTLVITRFILKKFDRKTFKLYKQLFF